MPSLIDIRRRIRSVKNTQQITKAMKMVSAAKLRRAQDRVISARPYSNLLHEMLSDAAAAAGEGANDASPLLAVRPEKRILIVLITGDKGLAGAFNANIIKTCQRFSEEQAGAELHYELVGRKGRDFYRKRGVRIRSEHLGLTAKVKFADAKELASSVIEAFSAGEIDSVYVINNEFKSVIAQNLTVLKLLPVEVPAGAERVDYLFEQPPAELLGRLLPRYVETQINRALLESSAAEHAARMTAMDAATSNAAEMIEKLTLYMNRVRQASITKEIIEVVSGAAAAG